MNNELCHQDSTQLIAALSRGAAYPPQSGEVQMIETHISWVFLVGSTAYKVKKELQTPFLDYRGLARREACCRAELQINQQFAPELYQAVVPIALDGHQWRVEGTGTPVEWAVKMRRFDAGSLLSERLLTGEVGREAVERLAQRVAHIHASARRLTAHDRYVQSSILDDAVENLTELQPALEGEAAGLIRSLQRWTRDRFAELESQQQQRFEQGFVRECHGDLHCGNIVYWHGEFVPFDGVEFNDSFRCIDVLSDVAFLTMDLLARGHNSLRHAFINAYVEQTADWGALGLLRWYEVYRSLVRAKVAMLRAEQCAQAAAKASPPRSSDTATAEAKQDCLSHVELAHRLAEQPAPILTITHGASGSGKTLRSQQIVLHRGAIRLRSDVERKRMFGLEPLHRPQGALAAELYSPENTAKLYSLLLSMAEEILRAGTSVVIDATFLKLHQRRAARELASRLGIEFNIVDCQASDKVLRERIAARGASDASDANANVLEQQLMHREPLTHDEQQCVVEVAIEE